MLFCPNCRREFQDQEEVCIDCGVELVDKLPDSTPGPMTPPLEPLVTIVTFKGLEEAYLNQAYLESGGIDSFVADWRYLTPGGFQLQVRKSDVGAALSLLNDIPKDIPKEAPDSIKGSEEHCPKCNSADVHYEKSRTCPIFLCWLLLGFPLLFPTRKWKCHTCGYEWRLENPEDTELP